MLNVLKLLPKQIEFLTSEEPDVTMVTGLGYGKTTAGSLFVMQQTSESPGVPGLIVANTYSQLRSATLTNLQMWCEKLDIFYKYNTSTKMVTVHDTEHFVRSAENFKVGRGLEAGWLWCDERSWISEEAAEVFEGRIRFKGGSHKIRSTTTPNGYNEFYHRYHPSGDNYDPTTKMIRAKTSENFFLPETYEPRLRRRYSSQMAAQELDAEFISMKGMSCYGDFDRNKHVTHCRAKFQNKPSQQLYAVCDYNIDPFTAVVGFEEDGKVYIIDEIFLTGGADTRMMAKEIKKRWGHASPIVVGDGTGNTKRSIINIRQTSYGIFQEEGLVTAHFSNPHVVKRLDNVNSILFHEEMEIDVSCSHVIRDLELVCYAKNSNDIDKRSNPLLTHISDSLGYLLWKLKCPLVDYQPKTIRY